MAVVFGFLLFLIGFAMLMAGVGLLLYGEIKLKGGKRIPKEVGRKAGIALVSFLPAALMIIFIFRKVIPDQSIPSAAVTGPLALVCLGLAARWVSRGIAGARSTSHKAISASTNSFATSEPVMLELADPPPPGPALGKPAGPKPAGKNPFDFS